MVNHPVKIHYLEDHPTNRFIAEDHRGEFTHLSME